MEHKNFLPLYLEIKRQEVQELNNQLQRYPNGEYSFEDGEDTPWVTATLDDVQLASEYKVKRLKYPIGVDTGIIVQVETNYNSFEEEEIGHTDVEFGDISSIMDYMKEPMDIIEG